MQLFKKLSLICALILSASVLMHAQGGFKYQAVIRDADGDVIRNTQTDVRLSIHTEFGDLVYSELHNERTTNEFGIIGLIVGNGVKESGPDLMEIDWLADPHSLTVELSMPEIQNGDWIFYGTSRIYSVPIAMYAHTVADKDDADPDPENEIQNLSLVDNVLSISDGNSVTLSSSGGSDQVLSLEGSNLSISDGNTINLAPILNDSISGVTQQLSLNGNQLSISGDGGNTITIPVSDNLQNLSLIDNVLSISEGNSVTLPLINGSQNLSLDGTILIIENGNSVDLSDLIPEVMGADDQVLSLDGTRLILEDGGEVELLGLIQQTNQAISYDETTSILSLDNGGSVDLSGLRSTGGGSDSQDLTNAILIGTELTIEIEGGNPVTVDLAALPVSADNQEIINLELAGDDLVLEIENGNRVTVDLSSLGGGSDNQAISYDEATNILSLENGGTVDLSELEGGTTGGSNQNLTSATISGSELTIEIEDGNPVTVDLSGLPDNVDDADASPINEIQELQLNANNLELVSSDGTVSGSIPYSTGVADADADPMNELQELVFNDTDNMIGITDGNSVDLSSFKQDISFDVGTNELSITGGSSIILPSGNTDSDADPTNEIQDLIFNDTDFEIGITGSPSAINLSAFVSPWQQVYTLSDPPTLVALHAGTTPITGDRGVFVSDTEFDVGTGGRFEGSTIGAEGLVQPINSVAQNLKGLRGEVFGFVTEENNTLIGVEGKVTTGDRGTATAIYGSVTGGETGYGIQVGASESQHAVGGRFAGFGRESSRGLEVFASGGNDDLVGMTMQVQGAEFAIGSHYEVYAKSLIGRLGEYGGPDDSFITGSQNTISGDGRLVGYQSLITGSTSNLATDELIGFNAEIGGFNMTPASEAIGAKLDVSALGGSAVGVDIDLVGDGATGINIFADSNNSYSTRGVSLFLNGTGSNVSGINSNVGSNLDADIATAGNFIASDADRASYGIIARGKSIASQSFLSGTVEERSRPLTIQSAILGNDSFQAASFNSSSGQTAAIYDYAVLGINKTDGQSIDGDYTVGVAGFAEGASSSNYGVWGQSVANTGYFNTGVFGKNLGAGTSDYAGYFVGKVRVSGNLEKAGGTFKIDHPQDPANKYLVHSFVESPDMMNIYNGNTKTDNSGKSTVVLPDYFESLNIEFRYQLTVIGEFAQAIVSQKVDGNTFEIMTDKPNVEVSWQVTGVRNDPWAQKNRVVDVVDKKEDRGTYLMPELYGQPQSKAYLQMDREPSKNLKDKQSISLEESLIEIRKNQKNPK